MRAELNIKFIAYNLRAILIYDFLLSLSESRVYIDQRLNKCKTKELQNDNALPGGGIFLKTDVLTVGAHENVRI
ncbi:MAG: hypothetical protein ACE5FT_05285, partial [Candidatus Nanoarchaeia archaeon]